MSSARAHVPAWNRLHAEFLACHRHTGNVVAHLVTTPVGLAGVAAALAGVHPLLPAASVALYAASLVGRVPWGVWGASAVVLVGLERLTAWLEPSAAVAALLVGLGYVGQEAAHRVSGEPSLQGRYERSPGALRTFVAHTWLLLPLVLDAASRLPAHGASWLVARRRVLHIRLTEPTAASDLDTVRAWVEQHALAAHHTTHWWVSDLAPDARAAFERLAVAPSILAAFEDHTGPGWTVVAVPRMNEVYVTAPESDRSSDTVFYRTHVDGPFAVFPGCSVFRCMVGVTPNEAVTTHFPLAGGGGAPSLGITLTRGEALAFDFHRELHHITSDPSRVATHRRINLKLHFLVCPRVLAPWGRVYAAWSSFYDERARELFLGTLTPRSPVQRLGAHVILAVTRGFDLAQRHVGLTNLAWVAALAAASVAVGSALPLVLGASFVHYLMYLAAFHVRRDVAFGAFVRDAVFFKAVSFAVLGALYLSARTWDPVSAVLVAAGFGLSAISARALGWQRTYFGVELGAVAPGRVDRFPYGTIPHPMIAGSVVGLLGVHALAPFREAWPWLVPAHLVLYAVHLLQEATDWHLAPADPAAAQPLTAPSRRGTPA